MRLNVQTVSLAALTALAVSLICLPAKAQVPVNDPFEDRLPLGGLVESLTGTNTLCTTETNEPPHRGLPAVRSLWWRWVAPSDGYVLVTTTNSPVRTRVAVYDGSKKLALLHAESLQNESGLPAALDRFEFNAFNGLHYNIAVDGRNGDQGPIHLDLKVYTKPEIIIQPWPVWPARTNVTAGQRASLAVRALGKLPLTNQWQFSMFSQNTGFINIPGAAGRQFDIGTFGVVAKSDEGWYRVIVRNEFGAVTSSVVRVDVSECVIPGTPQPSFFSNNVGKTASFIGTAVGTVPIQYQWQFRPQNHWDYVDLPGAISNSLTLTNISTDDAGEYRFLVSNIACTNQPSTNTTLVVGITNALICNPAYPTNLIRITNQNALFIARVVEGYQPIHCQWWFRPLSGSARPLIGETALDLFLSGLQLSNAGDYWAVFSNRYAVCTSPQAQLTVQTRPPNDNFDKRTPIFPAWTNLSTTNVSRTNVYGWNKNGTSEPGERSHLGRAAQQSVWWNFQAPVEGHVIVFLTTIPPGTGVLAAYTGDSVSNLVPVLNLTNRTDMYDFVSTTNTEYFFAVEANSGIYLTNNIALDFIFNPNLGPPTIFKEPKDLGMEFFMMGGLDGGGGGCRTFDRLVVQAMSLDGVVNYQWQFGLSTNDASFTDLPGMTNGTLVLPNVTTAHQGWYRARISNATTNPATSNVFVVFTVPVHLTVGIGPQITQDIKPKSVNTNACTAAKFEVSAESCSPLHYEWRQNGLPVVEPNALGVNSKILVITNLSPANVGTYDVVIWNDHLSTNSGQATLTLTNTPRIASQPQPITRRGCENAAFSVGAFANCPLTYQWYFQSNPVIGAVANTLNLTNLQPANAGDYFAVVSTPYGSATSQVARLTVVIAPQILKSPTSQNVKACDIVNLDVQVQAEPPCSWIIYQWQLAGTNIPSATNRVYSFEAQAETAGNYRVIVSNLWTNVFTATANVVVDARPQITMQPAPNQRIRAGDPFTNRINASICGFLGYTWQFKPLGSNDFSDLAVPLTTNGWLIVQNAQTNDSGYYRVVVTNIYATVTSAVAFVRVVLPPLNDHFTNAFSLGRTNQAVGRGHNEFATAEPGEPSHGLQPPNHSVWWVWTNPYPSLVTVDLAGSDIDTTLGVYTGTSVSNLTILALDDDGGAGGRSRVSFMAGGGKALYFAVDGKRGAEGTNMVVAVSAIAITLPPIITEQPVNLAATAGETVTFTNRSYGSPDMMIQWFGKGAPVQGVTRIVGLTNYLSTLTLNNVTTNDQGVYYAVLTNDFGAVTTKLATLTFGSLVRGMVTDATRTTPAGAAIGIPGVRVAVGDVSAITDADGNYELVGVKLGELRADFMANKTRVCLNENVQFWNHSTLTAALLTASKEGFYDYVDSQFEVGKGQTVAKRFSMSPIFSGLRFVMNWTNKPGDLDLVLHLPESIPISYHWIDYLEQNRGSTSAPPYAIRDADMFTGWGPETISIHQFSNGTYSLYARKYPGEGGFTLTQSDAQIVAYVGGDLHPGNPTQLQPHGAINVPTQGTNDWWYVCDIDGATTNITWINRLLPGAPGGLEPEAQLPVQALPAALGAPPLVRSAAPKTINYTWNFGDGSPVSNAYEPTHSYADPGWKTVSLTVTEQVGNPPKSHTTTKTNYIYVENMPPTVAITNPLPNTIFRAGDPITLQSVADGVDDAIQHVEYYLVSGQTKTFIGRTTVAPYTWVFPNSSFVDSTNTFVALAQDVHGATAWSTPVTTRTYDLRGDILILRNFPSLEIDRMVSYLSSQDGLIMFRNAAGQISWRAPIVKVLDQEGLHFGLVRDFKLIIWDDQGEFAGGLTDNDVAVLQQAYSTGIPLYLIGEKLAESRDYLTNLERFHQWTALTGMQRQGTISGPHTIHGIQEPYEDGLFYGWYPYWIASTELPYSGNVEKLQLLRNDVDVVAEVPAQGSPNNAPLMLRYPRFAAPDFAETRLLVQNFRVTSAQNPQPPEDEASRVDRGVVFINGCAWLMRMYECQRINPLLTCVTPPSSLQVGQLATNTVVISQNGECVMGGALVTNTVSPRLQVVAAELEGVAATNYEIEITNNRVIVRLASLPPQAMYQLHTTVMPVCGGWFTNTYALTRGLYVGVPCVQSGDIQGVTSSPPVLTCLAPEPLLDGLPDPQGHIPSGRVGQLTTNTLSVAQNADCNADSLFITNMISPHVRLVAAEVVGLDGVEYRLRLTNNIVVLIVPPLGSSASYQLKSMVIPACDGWYTNHCTLDWGATAPLACSQAGLVEEATGLALFMTCVEPPLLNLTPTEGPLPRGRMGYEMTNTVRVAFDGECTAGLITLSARLSPDVVVSTTQVTGLRQNDYLIQNTGTEIRVVVPDLPSHAFFELQAAVVPTRIGWMTNQFTLARGHYTIMNAWQRSYIAPGDVRLQARFEANQRLRLSVLGGASAMFKLLSSTNLTSWSDVIEVQPDCDSYELPLLSGEDAVRFYRLVWVPGAPQ